VGGFILFGKNKVVDNNSNFPRTPQSSSQVTEGEEPPMPGPEEGSLPLKPQPSPGGKLSAFQVIYTDSGFSPSPLTIKVGDTVAFTNQSSKDMWPASAMHPTHKGYPGSDIQKCGTSEESEIFDACRGIPPGGSWSFKFVNAGSWNYHDHLNSSKFGKIVVE